MVTNSDYKIAVTATYQQSAHRWVRWRTYTLWYNSAWPGICIHAVFAQNVSEARKLAMIFSLSLEDFLGDEVSALPDVVLKKEKAKEKKSDIRIIMPRADVNKFKELNY